MNCSSIKNTSNSKECVVSKHNRQLSKEPSLNCIIRISYKQLVAKMHNLFPCLWIYEKYHIPHAVASAKCLIGNGLDFQFDNDLKHTANSVKAYLDRKHTVANSGMSLEVWRTTPKRVWPVKVGWTLIFNRIVRNEYALFLPYVLYFHVYLHMVWWITSHMSHFPGKTSKEMRGVSSLLYSTVFVKFQFLQFSS